MLFNIETKTAIFLPPKTASVSLTQALSLKGWKNIYGPKPWASKELSSHVQKLEATTVDDDKIERHFVTFREPISRTVSLYCFCVQRYGCNFSFLGWLEWLESFPDLDQTPFRNQVSYGDNPDGYLRTQHLEQDCLELLGVTIILPRLNVTHGLGVNARNVELRLIRKLYSKDFAQYEQR